jgi:hypothetical protein
VAKRLLLTLGAIGALLTLGAVPAQASVIGERSSDEPTLNPSIEVSFVCTTHNSGSAANAGDLTLTTGFTEDENAEAAAGGPEDDPNTGFAFYDVNVTSHGPVSVTMPEDSTDARVIHLTGLHNGDVLQATLLFNGGSDGQLQTIHSNMVTVNCAPPPPTPTPTPTTPPTSNPTPTPTTSTPPSTPGLPATGHPAN